MAATTLNIIAKLRDQVSEPMKKVQRGLKDAADGAKKSSLNFTELNKVLFSTRAYFGILSGMLSSFKKDITEAAQMERVQTSFQNVFGPHSDILMSISKFSSIGVDRMTAMKDAISLGMLGIAKSSDQAAQLLSGAAFGAKMAGVDTSSAMNKIVQSLKDGSLSGLEYLNMIRSSDPVLKAQLELLHKYSGSVGGAVTAQAKYNLILSITNRLSQLAAGNQEDMVDTMQKFDNSVTVLQQSLGSFLGRAFQPFIGLIQSGIQHLYLFIENNTRTNHGLTYLVRAFGAATASAAAFLSVMTAISAVNKVLALSGVGFPFLRTGILGVAAAFLITTGSANGLIDKLKLFGNLIEGVWQLVSSFNPKTGFAQIDKNLADLLRKNNLWNFANNVARAVDLIVQAVRGAINIFDSLREKVSSVFPVVNKWIMGGQGGAPWSKGLLGTAETVGGGILAAGAGAFLAKKVVGMLGGFPLVGGLLKKIPGLGGIFGKTAGIGATIAGGGRSPSGTAADPLHVKIVGGILGASVSSEKGKEAALAELEKFFSKTAAGGVAEAATGATVARAVAAALATISLSEIVGLVIAAVGAYNIGQKLDQMFGQMFSYRDKADKAILGMLPSGGTNLPLSELPKPTLQQKLQFVAPTATPPPLQIPTKTTQLGLNETGKVAYVPKLPTGASGQYMQQFLQETLKHIPSKETHERKVFSEHIKELIQAVKEGRDIQTEKKIFEDAFVQGMKRTEKATHTGMKMRGC